MQKVMRNGPCSFPVAWSLVLFLLRLMCKLAFLDPSASYHCFILNLHISHLYEHYSY